ncbi:N-acetylmuramoyl-L-alanine amidase [Merdimmobilis hominis]|uniref:N-acetylmuramoyl-L-alanine amidase family protein n=1 Tax=Merdimmobilis hominis TaxID=2897707 RepID=UPI00280442EC|nr:N-acetylmuramoyl-L-alanine amidase [uncultured Merdimmobilis sp.]
MNQFISRIAALTLAVAMAAAPTTAYAANYNDMDSVTNTGVSTKVSQKLAVQKPAQDIKVTSATYYITGTSNPNESLYVNGQQVTNRGKYGSFGVFVSLELGDNVFNFQNGDATDSVTLTRVASAAYLDVSTTSYLTNPFPTYDNAFPAGKTIKIKCVAPSGASVSANVGGQTVYLSQDVSTTKKGVAANFSGSYTVPNSNANQTVNLGKVTYTMNYNGKTSTYTSAGNLFSIGSGATLVVKANQNATATYAKGDTSSNFVSILRMGTTDRVIGQNDTMYQLGMGAWVSKNLVTPQTGAPGYWNEVSSIGFDSDSKGEKYILEGTANAPFTAEWNGNKVILTLYNTTGVGSLNAEVSNIFTDITVNNKGNGVCEITFTMPSASNLWGYNVEYNEEGETTLYFKYPPKKSSDSDRPLKGITVALDAGHGGTDVGALGTAGVKGGPTENTLTLATVLTTKNRLESLGAKVILARNKDTYTTNNARMGEAMEEKADFFVSLHCNSVGVTVDAGKPSGTEVYYYEDLSKNFAAAISEKVASYNGRTNRGAKYSAYRVTLNSYAPSVLVEMGFISNPVEYDEICSPEGQFKTANAVADAILASL